MRHTVISQADKGLLFTDTNTCSVNSNFGAGIYLHISLLYQYLDVLGEVPTL